MHLVQQVQGHLPLRPSVGLLETSVEEFSQNEGGEKVTLSPSRFLNQISFLPPPKKKGWPGNSAGDLFGMVSSLDLLERLSDLQLGDKKVTLNHVGG